MICQRILPLNGPKWLCGDCENAPQPIEPPVCRKCGRPQETDGVCADCRRRKRAFEKNTAVFVYDDLMRDLIHQFKYSSRPRYGYGLAMLMARFADKSVWEGVDVLIPAPMYPRKQRKRGYNQAEILAEALSSWTEIPMRADLLFRVRDTKPQSALGPAERKNNLKNAFSAAEKKISLGAKSFLIIDDIYTTGETLSACSDALLESGAIRVRGLTAAIAVPN